MLAAKGCLLALLWSACWLIAGVLASVSLAAQPPALAAVVVHLRLVVSRRPADRVWR